jgi:hypothetical protein
MITTAVIVSRNDDYGGNLLKRAILCLNAMTQVFDEVIYVDWNSPQRSLIQEIRYDLVQRKRLKHILVPSNLAKELVPDPGAQDCCEVMGRNIGIRRANGNYIVSTNIDIIPTKLDLKLDSGCFWVAARRDVPNWLSVHGGGGDVAVMDHIKSADLPRKSDAQDGHSLVVCCGDFQLAHRSVWWAIRGFEEAMIYRAFADTNVIIKARQAGFKTEKLDYDCYHLNHYDAAYHQMHQVKPLNDKERFINQFRGTANSEFWGYAQRAFHTEVI